MSPVKTSYQSLSEPRNPVHSGPALLEGRSNFTAELGATGIPSSTTIPGDQMHRICAARAHNSLQPISKLPAELIRDIFDCIPNGPNELTHMVPNLPEATAVFHAWRVASISYPALWRKIQIVDDVPREFGGFPVSHTSNDLDRLKTHFTRCGNLGIDIMLSCSGTDAHGLEIILPLIYAQSHRLEKLHIYVDGNIPTTISPHLPRLLFPLPEKLSKLKDLHVSTHIKWDTNEDAPTAIPFLHCGSDLALRTLSLGGSFCPVFGSIDPSRLQTLRLEFTPFSKSSTFYELLQGATSLRRLEMYGGKTPQVPHAPSESSSTSMYTPLALPELRSLHLGGLRVDESPKDASAWSQISHLLDVSSVKHFTVWCPTDNWYGHGETSDTFIAQLASLRSLHVPRLPVGLGDVDVDVDVDVNAWLSGKRDLVGLLLPYQALERPCASAFHPGKVPALRYLVLYAAPSPDGSKPYSVPSFDLEIQSILAINQLVRIIYSGFHPSSLPPPPARFREADATFTWDAEELETLDEIADLMEDGGEVYVNMEAVLEAHDKGDVDFLNRCGFT